MSSIRILFAGGGTGGHVYPALAMASELKKKGHDCFFVGTKYKMEAVAVPKAGFPFYSIWISGFQRSLKFSNFIFPLKVFVSLIQSYLIIKKIKPHVVVGTGGYASGPILYMAYLLSIKTLIQEQNSYPGVTTRILESKVDEVHIAFTRAKDYLIKAKHIFVTGNPIRLNHVSKSTEELSIKFKLKMPLTVAIVGGSLGAKSINDAISSLIKLNCFAEINVLWQCGKTTFNEFKHHESENIHVYEFIDDIYDLYDAADIVICRAGAITLAELAEHSQASIIIPLKSAAANHQYHNAKAFADNQACILIKDDDHIIENLKLELQKLLSSKEKRLSLKENMHRFALPNATLKLAEHIENLSK
jgi:UDP-N-acetylglucosamine--N-acetylmuramyl-(pentapeptide) pyrophosphoryl-undecaprenol N-acetylglucosamine transferase